MSAAPSSPALDADVLIAGYGPTGATLAALLARRGWRVIVLDQASAIYDKPRAITADQEALRIFQELGLADDVVARAIPHPGTDYLGMDGQVIKRFYPAPPPDPLGWMPNFMFVQPELEATLREAVEQHDTVRTLLLHRLLSVQQDREQVVAQVLRLADGAPVSLRARYLVAADGASSVVRKQLMPAVEDLAFDEWWLIVDCWLRRPMDLPSRAVQYCRPSRPGTYMVGPGGLRRWEIKMLPHERPEQFQSHEAVWRVLGEFVDTSGLEHCRTAVYRFHALVVDQWRRGRVFLAGDAAHQMPPFLGQGLCAGLRDALNLAWKLDAVMRGQAADTLLDTYTPERKRHVRTVVGHAKSFGLIIGELDPVAARERDARLLADLAAGRAETVRQRFIPGLETGLIDAAADGTPAAGAGELLVQPWVRTGTGPWHRLDDAIGANLLLLQHADWLQALSPDLRRRWAALGGRCAVLGADTVPLDDGVLALDERDGLLAGWLQARGVSALVARPDRYVYGVADSSEGLGRLLQALMDAMAGTAAPQPLAQAA